ncbi:Zinc finger, RING-type [Sesbania bispinosa]|nr:Zinc finger, RING-type [Sesbania bispinosa]
MAVAGLQNAAVPVLESTFHRDSNSQSPGRQGDGGRGGTRSSSLLQMWREIEDEQVVRQVQGRPGEVLIRQRSDGLAADLPQENMQDGHQREGHVTEDAVLGENESETWSQSQSQNGSHDEQEESNNFSRENSSDIGEIERERVRQIFREWMNSGSSRDHASSISRGNSGSRGEWLGETEQERVSIVREWVQMSSQQRGVSLGENREEQSAEFGTQIECVRDGSVVNQNEGQTEHTRRGIRKLRGRQFLLDILKKAEMERQREVQELLDHRAVSHFPHRNRIQALLRGRFLRNDRLVDNNRPTSISDSELGLLRQKQTVSGLREGFFFRKDNSGCSQATGNLSDTSSDIDIDVNTIEQTGSTSSQVVPTVHSEQSEPNNMGSDRLCISSGQICSQGTACENLDLQDSSAHVETRDWESSSSIRAERRDGTEQNVDMMPTAHVETRDWESSSNMEHSNMQELSGVHAEQSQLGDITGDESNLSNPNNHVEGNIVDDVNSIESVVLEREEQEEVITENEGIDWHQTNVEWRDSAQESVDDNQLNSTSNEWPQNILGNEDVENSRLQEQEASEVWQEDGGFQEAVEIWLGGPSDNEVTPVGRIRGFYFPEDDNVYSVELRELLSRRSVSNLLRSTFRESLDQLIQSYVERQGHAHVEWELQETTPSSPLAERDLEQQGRDRIIGRDTVNSSLNLPLPPTPPPLPLWDRHSRHDNWSQNDINNQRLGMEWDIINDLRIDMVRLQQRMNNMQRMLETCMDMQLELQRSIRQEVSAALNRSTGSSVIVVADQVKFITGIHDHVSPDDKSKWECVRKGLCCICCESNIDSLLYRCGHMCTCSKCANDLLQSRRKCPMCHAPVVEVIRAYSIQ